MKWLILFFSIVRPFFGSSGEPNRSNPLADFKEMIKENAIKLVALFAVTSTLATLFASGIVIMAVDVGAQYDQNAYVYFSSMIAVGITLSFLSLIIALVGAKAISNESSKDKMQKREVLESIGTSHPLQDALALLVHDFIKEREIKRKQEEEEILTSRASRSQGSRSPEEKHHSTTDAPIH